MEKKYLEASLIKENGKIVFIASDETLDRHGEVVPLDSWYLNNFKKNPVLLVNHDYMVQNIVGSAIGIGVREVKATGKKALTFEPKFHGITQLSKEVEQMVNEGVLSTVSVGFRRIGPSKDGEMEKNELMEISFVPIPANPSAERLSVLSAKGIDANEEEKINEFMAGAGESEEEKTDDIVIPEEDTEVKEGRVLSGKNRKLITAASDALKSAIVVMEELLNSTDPTVEAEAPIETEPDVDEPKAPEGVAGKGGKGRARGNNLEVKILRHVAKEVNRALYKLKQNS